MKFIHLSDLHLGKRVNAFSMLEDQRYILEQILEIIERERPTAVMISGDVYDKPIPPAEAVALLDDFLVKLSHLDVSVFLISGNHDSSERLAFASRFMEKDRIYISPVYDGKLSPITLTDAFGPIDVWLLPFIKPVHVRRAFPDEEIVTYTDALACAISHMDIKTERRNVLLTHQFVTGSERCESEDVSVGGTDNVDVSVFAPFDYVALGHLHGPQAVDGDRVRYCGTPLKYSFSEIKHKKSVTVLELGANKSRVLRTIPLTPVRDFVELRGSYLELTARDFYKDLDREAYVRVILTDEEDIPEAVNKLRVIYPNLMRLDYDNKRTRGGQEVLPALDAERQSPLELFAALYKQQNNGDLSDEQEVYLQNVMESIWGGEA